MLDNTYGSLGLRIKRLNDRFGKHVKSDTLFLNLYDYWTEFYNPNKRYLWWHTHIIWKLEMYIGRKWSKDLPNVNIVFEKYKKEKVFFDPRRFKDEFDSEKYFELLKDRKIKFEQYHLLEKPYLRFGLHRDKKILGKAKTRL